MDDTDENIPRAVIAVVAEALPTVYSGTRIKTLFEEHGAPGDPPPGAKVDLTRSWLIRINEELSAPLAFLGSVLRELMETERNVGALFDQRWLDARERITVAMTRAGLAYRRGGKIVRGAPEWKDTRGLDSEAVSPLAAPLGYWVPGTA